MLKSKSQVKLRDNDTDTPVCVDCGMWLNKKRFSHDCRPDVPVTCTFTGKNWESAYWKRSGVPTFDSGTDFSSGDWQFEYHNPTNRMKIVNKAKENAADYRVRVKFRKGGC